MKELWRQLGLAAVGIFIISLIITLLIFWLRSSDDKIIDKAIKTKNASLCEKVKKITRPGPNDRPATITGQEAVNECKSYVEFGDRPYNVH